MSIESEKERLQAFLKEQIAVHEAAKVRHKEHCDKQVAIADFAIKTLRDHVDKQIALLDAGAKADALGLRPRPGAPVRTPDAVRCSLTWHHGKEMHKPDIGCRGRAAPRGLRREIHGRWGLGLFWLPPSA
jgi:hypothetical protein